MAKAVKKVVGVVAAIAIPFVAGPIASAIGLSGAIGSALGSAAAGEIIGSALVGAGLGAAKGAVFGEDIGRNALYGGIGGGIAGAFNAFAAPTTGAPAPIVEAAPTYSLTSAPLTSGAGVGLDYGFTSPSLASGTEFGLDYGFTSPSLASGAGFGPVDYGFTSPSLVSNAGFGPVDYGFTSPSLASSAEFAPVDYSLTPPPGFKFGPVNASSAGTIAGTAGSSTPTTFLGALKQVPSAIAEKFKDPTALADLTLRAAGMLAGSALAGDGLTPEERQLLNAQTEELRRLQQTDQALFNRRLEEAMALIGDAKYFDPEYFGLQSARRAQQAGAVAKRDAVRRLSGDARLAEARRYDLGIARNVGTAFDTGYNAGTQGRVSTRIAGLNALPTSYPTTSAAYYANLANVYNNAAERRRQTQEGIGTLFGTLTGRAYRQEEEEKRKKGLA